MTALVFRLEIPLNDVTNYGEIAAALRRIADGLLDCLPSEGDGGNVRLAQDLPEGKWAVAAEPTRAEELLKLAATAQTVFWDALLVLESELGVDVDGTKDLGDTSVDTLLEVE